MGPELAVLELRRVRSVHIVEVYTYEDEVEQYELQTRRAHWFFVFTRATGVPGFFGNDGWLCAKYGKSNRTKW
jgi:hypothetical protein